VEKSQHVFVLELIQYYLQFTKKLSFKDCEHTKSMAHLCIHYYLKSV